MTEQERAALEKLIDKYTIENILKALRLICFLRAIFHSIDDEQLAKRWRETPRKIGSIVDLEEWERPGWIAPDAGGSDCCKLGPLCNANCRNQFVTPMCFRLA